MQKSAGSVDVDPEDLDDIIRKEAEGGAHGVQGLNKRC